MKCMSPCLLLFGVLTLGASVFIGYYVVPYKVWENIMEQSKIVEGNTRFENWEEIPILLYQNIYFFNVTNPDEVNKGGRPILQEIGPYVYQQKRKKFDIVFNNENGTIFYREQSNYLFRPDLSNGSESDRITFVNIPFVSAAQKVENMDMLTRMVVVAIMKEYPDEQLYVNTTIGELMFGGRYLPFVEVLSELRGEEILPNNTFGLYYGKNSSDQGRFEIISGVKEPDQFGNVVSWNGNTSLDWWEDEYCNQINGSDGGIFQPYATKDTAFYMFIPGLCKSFRFDFEQDGIDEQGIPVYKYSLSKSFFESAKTNPNNTCYCSESDVSNCPEDGVFPLEKCGKGAMMLSQPHFYQGSDLYLNQSVGLHPDKDRHEMALYIEAYTSVTARVKMRFQMNINLQPVKSFRVLKKIPKMVHPLFWIDQNVEIPEEAACVLRERLHGTINLSTLLTHVGIILGLVLIILSLLTFFLCTSRSPKETEEGKIECVSYHPQGTLEKGKFVFSSSNGKINGPAQNLSGTDLHREREGFLPLLDNSPEFNDDATRDSTPEGHELVITRRSSTDDDDGYDTIDIDESSKSSDVNVNNHQCSSSSSDEPDSAKEPFPAVTDYPSSFSIVTNTPDLEATSSYENL